MVSIQATSNCLVTPQRTADRRFTEPTPIIEPVITCVVLTGILKISVKNSVNALEVCAQKPSRGVIFVILFPIVLIIFQPPVSVPRPIIVKQLNGTQSFIF